MLLRLHACAFGLAVALALLTGCGGGAAQRVSTTPERAVPVRPAGPAPEPAVIPEPEPATGAVHVVQAGQTLYSIARAYGTTVKRMAAVNGLADPGRLDVGQRLTVPGARAPREVPVAPAPVMTRALRWPVPGGEVLSRFGAPRGKRRHAGVDIRGRRGQPVVAVEAGRVVYSGNTMRGYGKTVIVDHGNGLQSLYAHNSKLLVRTGERVLRGQAIARVGRTGNASTDHCHLEIRRHDVPQDPLLYVSARTGSTR